MDKTDSRRFEPKSPSDSQKHQNKIWKRPHGKHMQPPGCRGDPGSVEEPPVYTGQVQETRVRTGRARPVSPAENGTIRFPLLRGKNGGIRY